MTNPRAQGRMLGRYRLVERLGAGGMAAVYRAVVEGPEGFARSVVIKRPHRELRRNGRFVREFAAEARLTALLRHPNIVQVFELAESDDGYFLVMEHVDGIDLRALMRVCNKEGRLFPQGLAAHIASEVAVALQYAHHLGDDEGKPIEIVHRDVSPSNIMVTNGGSLKLLDFGIARAMRSVRRDETRTGFTRGKLFYLSPEAADGRAVDARSDLFALGSVLYELITGRPPFVGEDDLDTLRLIREALTEPAARRRVDLDPELDAVLLKLMARERSDRFATGGEVAAALSPIVHRHGGDALGLQRFVASLPLPPPDHRLVGDEETPPDEARAKDTITHSVRRPVPGRAWKRPAIVLGIGLLAGAAILFARRPRPSAPPTRAALVEMKPSAATPPPLVPPKPEMREADVAPQPVPAAVEEDRSPRPKRRSATMRHERPPPVAADRSPPSATPRPTSTEEPEIEDPFQR